MTRVVRADRKPGRGRVVVHSTTAPRSSHVCSDDPVCVASEASPKKSDTSTTARLSTAERNRARAIHIGYGVLVETTAFAEPFVPSGSMFIGPKPDAIPEPVVDDIRAQLAIPRRLPEEHPFVTGNFGTAEIHRMQVHP